jgi:hypothetical protein
MTADLFAAGLVLVIAAVPLAPIVIWLLSRERGEAPWRRVAGLAIGAAATAALGVLVWGWAAATHLGPLCIAYGAAEVYTTEPVPVRAVHLDMDADVQADVAGELSTVASALATPGSEGRDIALQARQVTHHANRWLRVEMTRIAVRDRGFDSVLGEADEMWVIAGPHRFHCGVASGDEPVRSDAPVSPGRVAAFVRAVVAGARSTP